MGHIGPSSLSMGAVYIVELPLRQEHYVPIGIIGMIVAGVLCIGAFYRLASFMKVYDYNFREMCRLVPIFLQRGTDGLGSSPKLVLGKRLRGEPTDH